jgi:hypothetical protein
MGTRWIESSHHARGGQMPLALGLELKALLAFRWIK